MQKIPRGVVAIAVVLVLTAAIYFRQATKTIQSLRTETSKPTEIAVQKPREVSAVTSYEVPGDKIDKLRFVVRLDDAGIIEEIRTLDAETNEVPEKKKEFNGQVNVLLKGRKLSELSAIDKVGQSSLTTDAFNSVIDELKAAL